MSADTALAAEPPTRGQDALFTYDAFLSYNRKDGAVPPDAMALLCNKLSTNTSHQQWRDWVSADIDYIDTCPGLPISPDGSR